MRLVLDTHAFLWRAVGSDRLSTTASAAIDDPANDVFVSAASAWEIATKHRLGRLAEGAAIVERFSRTVKELRLADLAITAEHALLAGRFEVAHGDPFDRMLAAQAVLEGAALVTVDPAFQEFPVETLW